MGKQAKDTSSNQSTTTSALPETFMPPPYIPVTPLFTTPQPEEGSTNKDIESVIRDLEDNNHTLTSKTINTAGKVNAYLTHISHPTVKSLVGRMDENSKTVEQVAISLQDIKNYIGTNLTPLHSITANLQNDNRNLMNGVFQQAQVISALEAKPEDTKKLLANAISEKFH